MSKEILKAIRRSWTDIIQTPREHKWQPSQLCQAKLSVTLSGEPKLSHDKTKFKQYLSTNPALQKIIEGILQHKEGNYTHKKTRNQSAHNKHRRGEPHKHKFTTNNKNNRNKRSLDFNVSQHQWTQLPNKKIHSNRLHME